MTWLYPWQDGTVSIVWAATLEEACEELDAAGEVDPDRLIPAMPGYATFKVKRGSEEGDEELVFDEVSPHIVDQIVEVAEPEDEDAAEPEDDAVDDSPRKAPPQSPN